MPFSSGTSVFYNNGDYRFKNEMDQTFQLLLWCDEDNLYAELRCERPLPCRYRIVEEGHHFQKEGGKYYRVSKIYKETLDAQTGQKPLHRELVLDNHSEVMYDPALIPGVENCKWSAYVCKSDKPWCDRSAGYIVQVEADLRAGCRSSIWWVCRTPP